MQKILFLLSQLISLYALEQCNRIKLQSNVIPNLTTLGECSNTWTLVNGRVSKDCKNNISCTFFYLQYNIPVVNEWFGFTYIVSRRRENKTFNRFELHVLYGNIKRKILELPKNIPNSTGFLESNEAFNFSINQGYKTLSLDYGGQISVVLW